MGPFFNPTIEIVTFGLCGWCMLGVLLPAFTCLGHECQNLLSPCKGMHVCAQTRLFSERVLGKGVRNHVNSRGKDSLNPESQRRVEPAMLHHSGQRAQHATD